MKRFLWIIAMAVVGAAAGSAVRQKLDGEDEIVFAAGPGPVIAGALAGLFSPRAKRLVALVVGANVAANESGLKSRLSR